MGGFRHLVSCSLLASWQVPRSEWCERHSFPRAAGSLFFPSTPIHLRGLSPATAHPVGVLSWPLVFQTLECFSLLWWVFIPFKHGLGTRPKIKYLEINLYQLFNLLLFSSILRVAFSPYSSLCCAKTFKFNQVPLPYFFFYFHQSRKWVIEILAVIYIVECFAYVCL